MKAYGRVEMCLHAVNLVTVGSSSLNPGVHLVGGYATSIENGSSESRRGFQPPKSTKLLLSLEAHRSGGPAICWKLDKVRPSVLQLGEALELKTNTE